MTPSLPTIMGRILTFTFYTFASSQERTHWDFISVVTRGLHWRSSDSKFSRHSNTSVIVLAIFSLDNLEYFSDSQVFQTFCEALWDCFMFPTITFILNIIIIIIIIVVVVVVVIVVFAVFVVTMGSWKVLDPTKNAMTQKPWKVNSIPDIHSAV